MTCLNITPAGNFIQKNPIDLEELTNCNDCADFEKHCGRQLIPVKHSLLLSPSYINYSNMIRDFCLYRQGTKYRC